MSAADVAAQVERDISSVVAANALKRWFPADLPLDPVQRLAARQLAQRRFIFEGLKTSDQHEHLASPIKPFPRLRYIAEIADSSLAEKKLIVVASRQIMKTWTFAATSLYRLLERPRTEIGFITKKGEDGERHIEDRIKRVLWENLPLAIQDLYRIADAKGQFRITHKNIKGHWVPWDSWIIAYTQGADQVRSYVHTIVLWDEIAFMRLAEEMWKAVMPTLQTRGEGFGQLWAVSTVNPGHWFTEKLLEPWNYRRAREVALRAFRQEAA